MPLAPKSNEQTHKMATRPVGFASGKNQDEHVIHSALTGKWSSVRSPKLPNFTSKAKSQNHRIPQNAGNLNFSKTEVL